VAAVTGAQRGVPDISMSGACNGAVTCTRASRASRRLVPDLRDQRGHAAVRRIVALADQVAGHPLGLINPALYKMSALGPAGHRGRDQGQQHRLVQPGRPGAHRDRLQRPDRLRPRLRVGTVNAALFVPKLAQLAG